MRLVLILLLYFSTVCLSALIVGICWRYLANIYGLPSTTFMSSLVLVVGVRALLNPIRLVASQQNGEKK